MYKSCVTFESLKYDTIVLYLKHEGPLTSEDIRLKIEKQFGDNLSGKYNDIVKYLQTLKIEIDN